MTEIVVIVLGKTHVSMCELTEWSDTVFQTLLFFRVGCLIFFSLFLFKAIFTRAAQNGQYWSSQYESNQPNLGSI
jgi:hypothetical protein